MRKLFWIIMMLPITLSAQEDDARDVSADSIPMIEVKITVDELADLKNSNASFDKRLKAANMEIFDLQKRIIQDSISIKKYKSMISSLRADSLSTHNTLNNLKEQYLKSEKALISMASNFIYIPYEAYSIDSIAVCAFEAVSDKSIIGKYQIRYTLLKNYKKDIVDLVGFLKHHQEELYSNPFRNDANDIITALHKQSFYKSYQQYDDWESTFLGTKILLIENQLKAFRKSSKLNFNNIISDLENCLKTEE